MPKNFWFIDVILLKDKSSLTIENPILFDKALNPISVILLFESLSLSIIGAYFNASATADIYLSPNFWPFILSYVESPLCFISPTLHGSIPIF